MASAGVVGLGKMGSALAQRLLDQGVAVTVWNRSPGPAEALGQAGARRAERLGDVWDGTEAVCTFLADDDAVRRVCLGPDGLLAAAPRGGVLVEMSTISPGASAEVAAQAATVGVAYLRAPVSGNPAVLAAGNLALIVSGERDALEGVRPLLEHIGPRLFHVGGAEQARVVKLAVNAVLGATAELLAEVVVLGEANGLKRDDLLEVLAASAAGSPFVGYKRQALVEGDYAATFTAEMLLKDLRLVLDVAAGTRVPLPITALVADLTEATCAEGYGGLDLLALLPHLQRLAGRPADIPPATS